MFEAGPVTSPADGTLGAARRHAPAGRAQDQGATILEDLAAVGRRPDRGRFWDVDQRGYGRRIEHERGELWERNTASSERGLFGVGGGRKHGHDDTSRRRRFSHHDHCSRRIHHHDHCSRRIHHDHRRRWVHDDVSPIVGGRSRARSRPPALAAATRQLDQHDVYDNCGPLEYRLGVQLRPRPRHRSVVRGVRDPGGVGSFRNARHQRDRTVGTVGHGAVQPRGADARGANLGFLHVDRQGDRVVDPLDGHISGLEVTRQTSMTWMNAIHPGQELPPPLPLNCTSCVSRSSYPVRGRFCGPCSRSGSR